MAFLPIDTNTIKVGDPITKDLWDLIKSNFDDHETRLNSLATSTVSIYVINGDIDFVGYSSLDPNIFHYKVRQDFSLDDFRVQLFTKQGITSGTLAFDLQKSVDTNNANFASILSGTFSFDFSSGLVVDYFEKVATLNSALNSVSVGNVLRVVVTNVPFGFNGKVLMNIGGQ
jgi:hypothetical protein